MADTGGGGTSRGTGGDDWAAETAGRLDEIVTKIRTQTTDRVVKVARVVVYGVLLAVMGLMLGLLLLIAVVRGLDELIPQEVWLVYLIVGAIFTGAGLFCWSKRHPPTEKA